MSTERILNNEQNPSSLMSHAMDKEKTSGVVDINNLLARVRKEERKEYKINIIFFGMFAVLVIVVGILLSL